MFNAQRYFVNFDELKKDAAKYAESTNKELEAFKKELAKPAAVITTEEVDKETVETKPTFESYNIADDKSKGKQNKAKAK